MVATPTLNTDYERRAFWQASMPALPDRSGRELPEATDVVVIGGGYAGIMVWFGAAALYCPAV